MTPAIQINEEEVIENIWNALKLIGIKQDNEYYLVLSIKDNKVKLPSWYDDILKVYWLSNDKTIEEIEENLQYYIDIAQPLSRTESFINNRHTTDKQYIIRNNYVKTNIDTGKLIIIYTAIPIDEEGMPIVPTEINLIEALVWYNIKEYLWQMTIRNPNQYSSLFQKAEQEWSYYSIQAKTTSIFPKNEDDLNRIRNKYMKLLPKFDV